MRDKTTDTSPDGATDGPGGSTDDGPGPGEKLVRIGAAVFIVGMVATVVTVVPLLLDTTPFPTFMFLLSMLMGVGFLIAAVGLFQSISAQRRAARAAREAWEARSAKGR